MNENRRQFTALMALVDAFDNRLSSFGMEYGMSTGPLHPEIKDLREELVERGKGYGILPESADVYDVRHDATDLDVRVGFGGKWPYDGLEWWHGSLSIKAIERLEEKEDEHEPEEWLRDGPQYHLQKARLKHLSLASMLADDDVPDVDLIIRELADALNHSLMALDIMGRDDDER